MRDLPTASGMQFYIMLNWHPALFVSISLGRVPGKCSGYNGETQHAHYTLFSYMAMVLIETNH